MKQLKFIKAWLKQNEIPFATKGNAIFLDDLTIYELDYELITVDFDNNINSFELEEIIAVIADYQLEKELSA